MGPCAVNVSVMTMRLNVFAKLLHLSGERSVQVPRLAAAAAMAAMTAAGTAGRLADF